MDETPRDTQAPPQPAEGETPETGVSTHSPTPETVGSPEIPGTIHGTASKAAEAAEEERPNPRALYAELRSLDGRLVSFLRQRGRVLDKYLKARPNAPLPDLPAGAELERVLWREFERMMPRGASPAHWRALFSALNAIKLPPPEEGPKEGGFLLTPRRDPIAMAIPGPVSPRQCLLWAALIAQTPTCNVPSGEAADGNGSGVLAPVLANDEVLDGVKAFNEAGASLYREGETLKNRGCGLAPFTGKVLHAGDSLLTLELLIFLGLSRPGSFKIAASGEAKLADCSSLMRVTPLLGARLAPLSPKSHTPPLKVEVSGETPSEIDLPPDLSPDAAAALAVAAPTFARALTIRPASVLQREALSEAAELLRHFGITVEDSLAEPHGTLRVHPGAVLPPEEYTPAQDPFLAAALLATVRFVGGSASLSGPWPELATWRAAVSLLEASGLAVTQEANGISATATPVEPDEVLTLDTRAYPELAPLATLLAVDLRRRPGAVRLAFASQTREGQTGLAYAAESFLARFGLALGHDGEEDVYRLVPMSEAELREARFVERRPYTAPSPTWAVAFAVAALSRPGLRIGNAGAAVELLPRFWTIYNSLPSPDPARLGEQPPKETDDDAKPKRRRRIVK